MAFPADPEGPVRESFGFEKSSNPGCEDIQLGIWTQSSTTLPREGFLAHVSLASHGVLPLAHVLFDRLF